MSIRAALHYAALQREALTAKIGQRLYPMGAPVNPDRPYVVLLRTDRVEGRSLAEQGQWQAAALEWDVCDVDWMRAEDVAVALEDWLRDLGRSGSARLDVPGHPERSCFVRKVDLGGQEDDASLVDDGSGAFLYVVTVSAVVWYRRVAV